MAVLIDMTGLSLTTGLGAGEMIDPLYRRYRFSDDTIADVLDDAADWIEAHGWTQGTAEDNHGHVCLVGAVLRASHAQWVGSLTAVERTFLEASTAKVAQELGLLDDRDHYYPDHHDMPGLVATWNDHPSRRRQEVLDVLRLTAKHVRGVEG